MQTYSPEKRPQKNDKNVNDITRLSKDLAKWDWPNQGECPAVHNVFCLTFFYDAGVVPKSAATCTYVCSHCEASFMRWEGQCRNCKKWNTIHLVKTPTQPLAGKSAHAPSAALHGLYPMSQKLAHSQEGVRFSTGLSELDRVLGGGAVTASYVLLGGAPGVGKSTLLLQMSSFVGEHAGAVLYVSGEESAEQVALRSGRLGLSGKGVQVVSTTSFEDLCEHVKQLKPKLLVVDSIQRLCSQQVSGAPGTVSQVRECADKLMDLAKQFGVCVFLIGHITKDGSLAGPKTLEHMVDTVLSFEVDRGGEFCLLRCHKNRFGSTNELGVFKMDAKGLKGVPNPSELFLSDTAACSVGSAVFCAIEGTRPVVCELQALGVLSPHPQPRRTCVGFDTNRAHLLIAVLDKHLRLGGHRRDIFVNVVGGLSLREPAADLAFAAALVSSTCDVPFEARSCFFGEVGLTGEVRAVAHAAQRVQEAAKLGFKNFIIPQANVKSVQPVLAGKALGLKHVKFLKTLFNKTPKVVHAKTKPPLQGSSFAQHKGLSL